MLLVVTGLDVGLDGKIYIAVILDFIYKIREYCSSQSFRDTAI